MKQAEARSKRGISNNLSQLIIGCARHVIEESANDSWIEERPTQNVASSRARIPDILTRHAHIWPSLHPGVSPMSFVIKICEARL